MRSIKSSILISVLIPDQRELNRTSQIPSWCRGTTGFDERICSVFIFGSCFFVVSCTLWLGRRVFCSQSYLKFILRGKIKSQSAFTSSLWLKSSWCLISGAGWLLSRYLGMALFFRFILPPHCDCSKWIHQWVGGFRPLQSRTVNHGRLMFRSVFLMSEQKNFLVWIYIQYSLLWLDLFRSWVWVCHCCMWWFNHFNT